MNCSKSIIYLILLFFSPIGLSDENELSINSDYCLCNSGSAYIEKDSCIEFCKNNNEWRDRGDDLVFGNVILPEKIKNNPLTANLHEVCSFVDPETEFRNHCYLVYQWGEGRHLTTSQISTFVNTNSFRVMPHFRMGESNAPDNLILMGKLVIMTKSEKYTSLPIFFRKTPHWMSSGLTCLGEGTKFHNSQVEDNREIPQENIAEFNLIDLESILYVPETNTIYKDSAPIKRILLERDRNLKYSSSNKNLSITVFCNKNSIYLERKDFPETGVWYQKVKELKTGGKEFQL